MEKPKKWQAQYMTIKVVNLVCGRVDIHRNITSEDLGWIIVNPNLEVEILEQSQEDD